jgi:hypothetical protein
MQVASASDFSAVGTVSKLWPLRSLLKIYLLVVYFHVMVFIRCTMEYCWMNLCINCTRDLSSIHSMLHNICLAFIFQSLLKKDCAVWRLTARGLNSDIWMQYAACFTADKYNLWCGCGCCSSGILHGVGW